MELFTDIYIQMSLHSEIYTLPPYIWVLGCGACSHVMPLMKFAVCQMLPHVIVIYFAFQRSMIGNKTLDMEQVIIQNIIVSAT